MAPSPIEEPPAAPPVKLWLSVLIGAVIGLSIGLIRFPKIHYIPTFNGLQLIPALYVAVAIHEFGHLFFGTIVGIPPGASAIFKGEAR